MTTHTHNPSPAAEEVLDLINAEILTVVAEQLYFFKKSGMSRHTIREVLAGSLPVGPVSWHEISKLIELKYRQLKVTKALIITINKEVKHD